MDLLNMGVEHSVLLRAQRGLAPPPGVMPAAVHAQRAARRWVAGVHILGLVDFTPLQEAVVVTIETEIRHRDAVGQLAPAGSTPPRLHQHRCHTRPRADSTIYPPRCFS